MLTQIIAGDSLVQISRRAHEARALWNIPQYCGCPLALELADRKPNGFTKDLINNEPLLGMIKQENGENNTGTNGATDEQKSDDKTKDESSLTWLANLALSKEIEVRTWPFLIIFITLNVPFMVLDSLRNYSFRFLDNLLTICMES